MQEQQEEKIYGQMTFTDSRQIQHTAIGSKEGQAMFSHETS